MSYDFDIIVIGAGVVGLAIANELKSNTSKIVLIEKNNSFGLETSSRNSEVIHSGIHYPQDFLKSKLCILGRKLLYEYCKNNKVSFEKCGKLIIGNDFKSINTISSLDVIAKSKGIQSKVLCPDQINELEPNIIASCGLLIEESGVIDSHQYMHSLLVNLNNFNIPVAFKTELIGLERLNIGYEVKLLNPDGSIDKVNTKILINTTGLHSTYVSKMAGINENSYMQHYWKGDYFWVSGFQKEYIKRLIYPIPEKKMYGLGVHTTIDMTGRLKLGPNAVYLGTDLPISFEVDEKSKEDFFLSASRYIKDLSIHQLNPDFTGIRPKLQAPDDSLRDFIILNECERGLENFINLIGIESPGLTSSLAIGKYVESIINWDI